MIHVYVWSTNNFKSKALSITALVFISLGISILTTYIDFSQ